MSYKLCRYEPGQGDMLSRFVLPIAGRTYAKWVDTASAHEWARSEHGVHAWNARLADSSTYVLVYERPDESIAACAFVRITDEMAYLGGLYVEDIGRGLGRMLRDERLRIGRHAGARTAVMLVRQTNEPARNHAEKAGFSMVGEESCTQLPTVPRLVYAMTGLLHEQVTVSVTRPDRPVWS